MKTWRDLMGATLTEEERVIVQLLATATTHPALSHLRPEEVLERHVKYAAEVMACDKQTLSEMQDAGL